MSKTIINGIDVSECYFYGDNNCDVGYIADSYPKNCRNNPNCYFKQLKRLQKENEELKARLITLDDEVLTIEITFDEFERYKKYKHALEEIRENLIKLKTNDEDDFCYEFSKLQSKISEVLK